MEFFGIHGIDYFEVKEILVEFFRFYHAIFWEFFRKVDSIPIVSSYIYIQVLLSLNLDDI